MFCLPPGYKTDIRADTCEALPLKTYTCKVLMRHGNHGNTKGEKFAIVIYNVYSLCLNRYCALTAKVISAIMYIYYRSHIYNYLHVLPRTWWTQSSHTMYIQQLGEIVLPPRHNTVGVCNQISFLVLYYNSSRLVPFLEVINAPIQVPDIVDLTISF